MPVLKQATSLHCIYPLFLDLCSLFLDLCSSRWTEGLISAAKAVGLGAKLLVDAADRWTGKLANWQTGKLANT